MVSYTMNSPMVVSQWLFIRHLLVFIVYTITVDILVICNLSAIRPSYISTNTMMVGADTGLVGLTLGVGQTGQVLLLLLLLMVFLIGIPVYLWFWRNYLKRVVAFYGGKVQEYINKAYERVSLRVSDAGRKMSERVRT